MRNKVEQFIQSLASCTREASRDRLASRQACRNEMSNTFQTIANYSAGKLFNFM
jgi:hypothetical protein